MLFLTLYVWYLQGIVVITQIYFLTYWEDVNCLVFLCAVAELLIDLWRYLLVGIMYVLSVELIVMYISDARNIWEIIFSSLCYSF